MNKAISILLLLFVALTINAGNEAEQIHISVAMSQQCPLDNNTKTLLKNKLLSLATQNGVAATECSAIVMVPETSIVNESLIEGGMRNIHTVELQLSVIINNIITGTVFNTVNINCKGNGYSKTEAQRAAIKNIKEADYALSIDVTKQKIVSYYKSNTKSIISKANTLAHQQQYDEALTLLASYPESLPEYFQVASAIRDIFHKSQTRYCQQLLMSARSAYAQRDMTTASELLSLIDATSDCAIDARKLQQAIKRDADNVYNNEIALERESRQAKERIATASINAARDVAVAYCKRQTKYVFFW